MALSLAAIVMLAAGCGGGGHKSSTTTTTTTTSAAATTKAASTVAAKVNAAAAAAGLSGLATTANCRQLADLGAAYAKALQGANSSDVKKTSAILKQFADKTPSDIRPSFETVAAAYGKIADALQGVNIKQGSIPSPAVIAKLAKLGTEIDSSALAKAETNIATWAQKNCVAK
jgi:hypothetical protein